MREQNAIKLPRLGLFFLFCLSLVSTSRATSLLVDQSLQPPGWAEDLYYQASYFLLTPGTGQEFTPSYNGLDYVNLNLFNSVATSLGTFQVAIREDNINGMVLGLSDPLATTERFLDNNAHFTFSSTVSLTAGNLYALEIVQLGGDTGWNIEIPVYGFANGAEVDLSYSGGRLIYGGVPQNGMDLIFQEGVVSVPEPSGLGLSLLGMLLFALFRKR